MGDEMNDAAAAFDADVAQPTETMFPNLGKLEVDEDSPAKGGGDNDDEILYKDPPKKRAKDAEDEGPDEEDEGVDDEGDEADDEGEDEDEDEDDDLAAGGKKYKVMVDGEEKQVPLKEALEGYIRTETFHKRMSEVDETNKIVYKAAQDVTQNFEYAKQMIQVMEGQMKELVPPEPDWDKLFAEDPNKARNLQKYYQSVAEFKAKLGEQRAAVLRQQQLHSAQQLKAYAEREELKFARINAKNWGTDPAKKAKDLASMRRTAQQEGFEDEEIDNVFDSRMLNVLLKASKYDRMMAARPKPVKQVAKPVTPGPGNKRTGRKGINEAMKRLARTGSLEDAAPVFDQIMRRS